MPSILHVACTTVNGTFEKLVHTPFVDMWTRVIEEIAKRPDGKGREETWLAQALGYDLPRVHNWSVRGIAHKEQALVAKALGWSVEQLTGAVEPPFDPWPFHMVSRARFESLTERQRGIVEMAIADALVKIDALEAQAAASRKPGKAA